jgi:orotidine-5'-phosphate decarboxylase
VGLDPQLSFLPEKLQKEVFAEYGETPEAIGHALIRFNTKIVDAVADLVPAVKPQIAMYEQFGLPGLEAFDKTVKYCREKDLVIIGDIKRGDIGSTSEAYARGHIGPVQVGSKALYAFQEDFVTLNPYMGSDSVLPFIKTAAPEKKGVFILVKTSNPSSGEFQDRTVDGRPLYEIVGEKVREWGDSLIDPETGYSEVGAVVGATYPEMGKRLREIMPKSYILVPGYGAQGGKGKDLVNFFNKDGLGAIVNSSRGIIAAWKNEKYAGFGEEGYAEASRQAVLDMQADIASAF